MTATLILALSLAPAQPGPVTLKWNLKEGNSFYAKSVMDMDMGMAIMGQNIDLGMKINSVQRFRVTAVKPGATTVEMTFVQMDMSMTGAPGGGIPGLGAIGERIKGATITATLDDKMEVTKVEGYDKFLDKLAGDDAAMRKQMKAQFSDATMSQMFSQVFSFAPSTPVKVGDTWSRTDKMPAGGMEATVKQKYKLDSVTGGVAKVTVTGDVSFKADGGLAGLPEGVTIDKIDMKADKYNSTLLFDTAAGRLTENRLDMDMGGKLTMSAMGQKLDMGMKLKAKQTTTVTDKNPVKD